ncbi:hypothetical protein [Antrihabitans spumae]|uniref:Uncharacterized protein n=1 Tax=Antrihabitans spumae TaxID=3373370 RepID=A0ABW7KF53_9NOCA
MRVAVLAVVAAVMLIAGCGQSTDGSATSLATTMPTTATLPSTTTPSPTLTTPTAAESAEFWLRIDREGWATMNVFQTYTDGQLEAAFLELKRMFKSTEAGGWHVSIDCGNGKDATGGSRQANGTFALDQRGAALTDLPVGGHKFEALPARDPCPPNLPSAPSALTAASVVDAIAAQGLPVIERRDTTGQVCANANCVQVITTKQFSVYQFADLDSATKLASSFPLGYQRGLIFIRFQRDGKNATDPALIPQYQTVLDSLVDG